MKIASPDRPTPGAMLVVRAVVANTGSSSAHDVLAFLPVPARTHYIARSARVAGRALLDVGDEPFDYAADQVIAQSLAPGASVEIEYQVIVDSPLPDNTSIEAACTISSREVAEFTVYAEPVAIGSLPDFANEETALTVFCDEFVSPGTRVPMTVRALNAGTGEAQNVSVNIDLPAGIAYTPGSAHIDGQPVSDEAFSAETFPLGTIASGRVVDVGISGIVVIQEADEVPVNVTLRWKGGERRFTRMLRIRVSSRFTRARNYLEVDRTIAQARQDVTYTAHVFNDGTAAEPDVRLRVIAGAFLEDVTIAETADEPVGYSEPFSLGIVQPHSERIFTIRARVASPVPDRTHSRLEPCWSSARERSIWALPISSRARVRTLRRKDARGFANRPACCGPAKRTTSRSASPTTAPTCCAARSSICCCRPSWFWNERKMRGATERACNSVPFPRRPRTKRA